MQITKIQVERETQQKEIKSTLQVLSNQRAKHPHSNQFNLHNNSSNTQVLLLKRISFLNRQLVQQVPCATNRHLCFE